MTIPEEYSDAARVDGCGEFKIMLTVILRLAKPAIAAVALFSFLYCWNDFFGPLLYTGENEHHWTVSLGLSQFRTTYQVHWNLTMAATILFMEPVIGLFAFLYAWNDFFGPLLYTGENAAHWTLSLGLSQFRTQYQVEWNLTMMATILFMAPVIALFFAAQKAFVEGVTLTGVKG